MFHVYFPNVSSHFPDVCLQVFHLDVTYIFTHMKCFQVFLTSVSYACFECFSYFVRMSSVSFGCLKSRTDVAASALDACFGAVRLAGFQTSRLVSPHSDTIHQPAAIVFLFHTTSRYSVLAFFFPDKRTGPKREIKLLAEISQILNHPSGEISSSPTRFLWLPPPNRYVFS